MAMDLRFYVVTEEVARRAGLQDQRYRTKDGRYILDNNDLGRIALTSDEYISGLHGVEVISKEDAKNMIAEGGYTIVSAQGNNETTNDKEDGQ